MFAHIKKKLKDKKGNGLGLSILGIILFLIVFFLWLLEMEHNIFVENKDRLERGLRSACKAGVMQVSKDDTKEAVNTDLDDMFNAAADTNKGVLLKSNFKNAMKINKELANQVVEKILCDMSGIGGANAPNGDIETLRKHLTIRAYTEVETNGDIKLTIFSTKDYSKQKPVIYTVKKAGADEMKLQIENKLNEYLSSNMINGKINKINLISNEKAIPELSVSKPCIILYLQEFPVKTFLRQRNLNVFYLSPVNIERKIKQD